MAEFHTDCFHCGLPVPAGSSWTLSIDAIEQPMCCPGCQVVARAIVENNLGSYYRDRISYSPKIDSLVPDALKLYDNDVLDAQFYGDSADQSLAMLSVEGIRCAACVWLIERRLSQVPGLQDAHLNVATEKLQVSWNPVQCKLSDILYFRSFQGWVQ